MKILLMELSIPIQCLRNEMLKDKWGKFTGGKKGIGKRIENI